MAGDWKQETPTRPLLTPGLGTGELTADHDPRGRLASDLMEECHKGSREELVRRYSHPWLLYELGEGEELSLPKQDLRRTIDTRQSSRAHTTVRNVRLAGKLGRIPHRMLFLPIAKGSTNPWQDRILVGRAINNDIIVRHPSVSKIHAYFIDNKDGGWWLQDAKSSNGTALNGARLEPGSGRPIVKGGSTLSFGALSCDFIEPDAIFDLLVPPLPR